MVKPEKSGHLHLVYHLTVPLICKKYLWFLSSHVIFAFIASSMALVKFPAARYFCSSS